MSMERRQSIGNREAPSDEEVAHLERKAKHWEAKHHVLHKVLLSPTVAAAILALFGSLLTAYLSFRNVSLQADIETVKQENALIIETLKADPTKAVSQLEALVDAGLLPHFGKQLHQKLRAMNQNRTGAPPH